MRLIVNADDFGLSESINSGIIEGYKEGIITSTTVMVNMPAFEHGVELAKQNSSLGVGVHLTFTVGKPITSNLNLLTKDNGEFHSWKEIENFADTDEVYAEAKAQVEKLITAGIKPTHLDGHHHVHTFKKLRDTFFKLAKEYNLPVRISDAEYKEEAKKYGLKTIDKLVVEFFDNPNEKVLIDAFNEASENDCLELMVHPGYMDEDTAKSTSYNYQRELELKELKRLKNSKIFTDMNVELINYKEL